MNEKLYLFSIYLVLWCSIVQSNENDEKVNLEKYVTNFINKELLPEDYNKNIRPNYGDKSVRMNVSLRINDISSISETSMDFKADFYIRHFWNDHRFSFTAKHNINRVTLGEEFTKKIWLPDTCFENAKEVNIHKTVSSKETTLFRIKSNGDVTYSTRISMIGKCPMDLTYFPMDQQRCSIEMSSYGETHDDVSYFWSDSPAVEFNSEIYLPQFRLIGYNKFTKMDVLSTGNFTRLQLDMFFVRSIGFYVSQVYIPALLVVIISWLPFWLDRNDHHARVALGVTTILTIVTLVTNVNSEFPKISHVKAIDIYLFVCFLMVFLSLIEFAYVGYYEVYYKGICKGVKQNGDENENKTADKPKHQVIHDTSIIDYSARRLFPICFLVFNVVYVVGMYYLVNLKANQTKIQVKL